eukprot:gnl/MRDRNA2_/MRDRNA2_86777_c0_seq10.p1 gnl/MRDRNA2_/MRDRNA2_86777_c0~~gnl/MRDRNA2_/MRDRNA2_86777_c0_seq10.p1  ORF type:complete len:190 (+),score=32.19 gnl/MRDRNA2_/MRDRNA2_86777_c0_seq10:56-571(+)
MTPLDRSIDKNSILITEYFLHEGLKPSVPYLLENRSDRIQEVLKEFCSDDDNARSKADLEGQSPIQAALNMDGFEVVQTYLLAGHDYRPYLDDHGLTIWHKIAIEKNFDHDYKMKILEYVGRFFPNQIHPGLIGIEAVYSNGSGCWAVRNADGGVYVWGDEKLGGDCSEVK